MEALKRIENYAIKYYDPDVNADPPSKSEPPSALLNDEPPSATYFYELESP